MCAFCAFLARTLSGHCAWLQPQSRLSAAESYHRLDLKRSSSRLVFLPQFRLQSSLALLFTTTTHRRLYFVRSTSGSDRPSPPCPPEDGSGVILSFGPLSLDTIPVAVFCQTSTLPPSVSLPPTSITAQEHSCPLLWYSNTGAYTKSTPSFLSLVLLSGTRVFLAWQRRFNLDLFCDTFSAARPALYIRKSMFQHQRIPQCPHFAT